MVERKTWSTAARHTRVVSATRRCCSVMYNFICHQTFHTNINQLTHQQQQQHYLFQCTNTSNCHCTATELLPSLVWCHFSHGQAGQQNVSIILVTPLTLNMHFETMWTWWNSTTLQGICPNTRMPDGLIKTTNDDEHHHHHNNNNKQVWQILKSRRQPAVSSPLLDEWLCVAKQMTYGIHYIRKKYM